MAKRKKDVFQRQKPLDTFSQKRGRGRPYQIRATEVAGRAENYRYIFSEIWDSVGDRLITAGSGEEILQVLANTSYQVEFSGIAKLMFEVIRDADFPKQNREARINFLADSLAARGAVSPRTSRDICAKARAKEKKRSHHRILCHEYYVECTCGYKGPARQNACRKRVLKSNGIAARTDSLSWVSC
jgi:hypothetical protein